MYKLGLEKEQDQSVGGKGSLQNVLESHYLPHWSSSGTSLRPKLPTQETEEQPQRDFKGEKIQE